MLSRVVRTKFDIYVFIMSHDIGKRLPFTVLCFSKLHSSMINGWAFRHFVFFNRVEAKLHSAYFEGIWADVYSLCLPSNKVTSKHSFWK